MKPKTMKIGSKMPPRMWWGSGAGATFTSFVSASGFKVVVVVVLVLEVNFGAAVVDVVAAVGFAFGVVKSGFKLVVEAVETFVAWVGVSVSVG